MQQTLAAAGGLAFRFHGMYAPIMTKHWNPQSPPMSLEESTRLLRDARNAEGTRNRFAIFFFELPLLLIGAAWAFGIVAAGYFAFKLLMFVTSL